MTSQGGAWQGKKESALGAIRRAMDGAEWRVQKGFALLHRQGS